MPNHTRPLHSLSLLPALKLTLICGGESSDTTGFTGTTALTTDTSTSTPTSSTTLEGSTAAPTTGAPDTGTLATTSEATSAGDPGTAGTSSGTSTGDTSIGYTDVTSYAYPGGLRLAAINPQCSTRNDPAARASARVASSGPSAQGISP